jgi:hypothetical protein
MAGYVITSKAVNWSVGRDVIAMGGIAERVDRLMRLDIQVFRG